MTKDSGALLDELKKALRLLKFQGEHEKDFRARVVYSAAGLNALAALWDAYDEDPMPENDPRRDDDASQGGVSVVRFKRRITETLEAFCDLFELCDKGVENICEETFNLFESAGCFYKSPNRVYPTAPNDGQATKNITFLRGTSPFETPLVAGLGLYSKKQTNRSVESLFQIDKTPLIDRFKREIQDINAAQDCSSIEPNDLQYLRAQPPFGRGYWSPKVEEGEPFSLARTENRQYYWRRQKDGIASFIQIPDWKTQDGEWRNLANALLANRKTLPNVEYERRGALVAVRLGYLLPPPEQKLFELYSWPLNLTDVFMGKPNKAGKIVSSPFERITKKEVFEALKVVFERLGYAFKERQNGK